MSMHFRPRKPGIAFLAIMWTLACATNPSAYAQPERQSLESIREAARKHVRAMYVDASAQVIIEPGYIDARLRLKPCAKPLNTFVASGGSRGPNKTVGVQCRGTWKIYVPVKIRHRTEVVVLDRPVSRGSPLTHRDLATRTRDVQQFSQGYFSDPAEAVGQIMRRPGVPGAVLKPSMLQPALVIEKGQRVQLILAGENFRVNAAGKALEDASQGQRLRVKNLSSNKTLEGIAAGPGQVEIR